MTASETAIYCYGGVACKGRIVTVALQRAIRYSCRWLRTGFGLLPVQLRLGVKYCLQVSSPNSRCLV